jgi:hypothetical protein
VPPPSSIISIDLSPQTAIGLRLDLKWSRQTSGRAPREISHHGITGT